MNHSTSFTRETHVWSESVAWEYPEINVLFIAVASRIHQSSYLSFLEPQILILYSVDFSIPYPMQEQRAQTPDAGLHIHYS